VDRQIPVRMAVVGTGYFGSYHCEKMSVLPDVRLVAVVDLDAQRAREAAARYGAEAYSSHRDLAGRVDAAVVAVPSQAHHLVAAELLEAGIDVLVEKPLATTLPAAEALCQLAKRHAACIQVGHLERFNPILQEALDRLRSPRFVRMERLGPFPGRGLDVDVVLELMTHDLDILLQLTQAQPTCVRAFGWNVVTSHLDLASARIEFADGLIAEIHASRTSSRRVRAFSVLDEDGLLEVDLAGRRLRRNSFASGRQQTEEVALDAGDPLLDQDRSFVDALTNGRKPKVSGQAGSAAVGLAEQILASISASQNGS